MQLGAPQDVVQHYGKSLLGNSETEMDMPLKTNLSAAPSPQGHARISHVEVSLNGIVGRVLHGKPSESDMSIRLQFESDPLLPAPAVGVTIDYGTLITVTCVVSRFENILIERDELGRGEVTIDFPKMPLRKGEYLVAVYLACEDAIHIYDNAQAVATLQIEDTLPSPGLVTFTNHWHTSAGHCLKSPSSLPSKNAGWQLTKLFNGREFWVDQADSLAIAKNGIFEPDETKLTRTLIQSGDKVLDIGANMGYYTSLFADWAGPTGIVHAVEPDPDNFALLNANTRDYQQLGIVRLYPCALSETAGNANLFRSKDNVGMHRLYDSICCDGSFTNVAVCSGDDLALAPLDFIKIDIEGYEMFALRGLEKTLSNSPNIKILCEFSPLSMMEAGIQPLEWIEWLEGHGLIPISYNGTIWSPVTLEQLKQDLHCLTNLDFIGLISQLQNHTMLNC
jgi:FkbM family methyltransferase